MVRIILDVHRKSVETPDVDDHQLIDSRVHFEVDQKLREVLSESASFENRFNDLLAAWYHSQFPILPQALSIEYLVFNGRSPLLDVIVLEPPRQDAEVRIRNRLIVKSIQVTVTNLYHQDRLAGLKISRI